MANVFGVRRGVDPAKMARDRRDAESAKITAVMVSDWKSQAQKWEIRRGTSLVGFVEQIRGEHGETHPCKAFPLTWNRQATFAGSFYGPDALGRASKAVAEYLK